MLPKSKVDLYAAIRCDARQGLSNRALQRKYGVGFLTVQKALSSAWPEPRKPLPPRVTRLDPFKPLIDEMLRADLDAPRKQRHTVKRTFERLVDEHGANEIPYHVVRGYVAGRREEIRVQAGRSVVEAFVPQTHKPGAEAEVDFGDVTVRLGSEVVTLLPVRVPHVLLGQGSAPDLRPGGAGGVLRGPRSRSQRAGRSADREGPLRQP
ncbi:hypothetical protein [Streptomyces sp. C36]|uniref:hypothetical protein n=1 Tax=Streptomyces sp. C36 TaxID=3237122 RepID=UPI0034C6DCD1